MVGRAERGFTLLEMLVVLALVSLLIGIGLPYLGKSGIDSATFAQDLAAQLAAARSHAVAQGQPVSYAFDEDGMPPGLTIQWALPPGQAIGRTGVVTFFPDGGATGGEIRIGGRGRDARVEIDWLTGGIRHGR